MTIYYCKYMCISVKSHVPFISESTKEHTICSNSLQRQLVLFGGRVSLQLHPVTTLTSLGMTLAKPSPFDAGIFLITYTPHHSKVIHGIYNGRLIFASLCSFNSFKEKGIFIS